MLFMQKEKNMKALYKLIYNPSINYILRNLIKKLSFVLSKKIRINPSGVISINIESQKIKLKTNQTSHITSQLFWDGSSEYEYSIIFNKLVKKVSSFIDIGASIGYYTISAAKLNPSITIHSIEPSKSVINYLKDNIELNKVSNQVKSYQTAFSDKIGSIEFFEIFNPKYPKISNLSGEHNAGSKKITFSKSTEVSTTTFDQFVIDNNLIDIDLIKIDTEGFESIILKNAHASIDKFKPIIICETLFNKIEGELEEIMITYNYEFYNHIGGNKLQKVNSIIRKNDNGVRNCFFVHPSKFNLIEEFVI